MSEKVISLKRLEEICVENRMKSIVDEKCSLLGDISIDVLLEAVEREVKKRNE